MEPHHTARMSSVNTLRMSGFAIPSRMGRLSDEIGARLRQAREQRQLSREQVASRLHISLATIQHHESGRNELKPEMALRYCNLYKVHIAWLFTGHGPVANDHGELVEVFDEIADDMQPTMLEILRAAKKSHPKKRAG